MKPSRCSWTGVFPAITTQFKDDGKFTLDLDATSRVIEGLIRDGVSGLIVPDGSLLKKPQPDLIGRTAASRSKT